jgi:hypothetical protein
MLLVRDEAVVCIVSVLSACPTANMKRSSLHGPILKRRAWMSSNSGVSLAALGAPAFRALRDSSRSVRDARRSIEQVVSDALGLLALLPAPSSPRLAGIQSP